MDFQDLASTKYQYVAAFLPIFLVGTIVRRP
jgi:hypothetical protein